MLSVSVDMSTVLIYIATWFGLAAITIANEMVRERLYGSRMPQAMALRLSTMVGFGLSALYIAFLTGIAPIASGRLALLISGIWFVMAIILEALLRRFIALHFWSGFPQDHRVFTGMLWAVMLLWAWALRLL